MSFQKILGEFIRKNRLEKDWSQKQLADASGVGLNFVYQLEKGKKSVQLDSVLKVLSGLKLTLDIIESSEEIIMTQKPQVETYYGTGRQLDPWAS